MKLSDLWTPKGRRATGKLSLDLLKITGKVAVAGTTEFGHWLGKGITSRPASNHDVAELTAEIRKLRKERSNMGDNS